MSRIGALEMLAAVPSGLTVGQTREIIGKHDHGTCRHCGRHMVDFSGRWVHSRGSRSCRSASFDADGDWDESLRPCWQATPGGQVPVDKCYVCDLLVSRADPPPDLRDGAGRGLTWEQFRAWVVSQTVRNELEAFHGGGGIDPDNPNNGDGFISDRQMRALNIVIRHAVYEALTRLGAAMGDQDAWRFIEFQLATVNDYMEPPGSPELKQAYEEVTGSG